MAGGLGKVELEFVMSLTAPLYWITRDGNGFRARNGSAFFLNAGQGVFGVTANHVIEGWKRDCSMGVMDLRLGNERINFDGKNALIAAHEGIDIATFRMSEGEISVIGKTTLTGYQKGWPPRPPEQDRGIYFGGFPGVEAIWLSREEISFGSTPGGGVANSISETDVCSLIERSNLIPLLGQGLPPENFDFRGMSGGPMLSVIEQSGLRSWALAGVIYEGPNPLPGDSQSIAGLEVIRARRAHFIHPDGTLDTIRWKQLGR
jgi:hypothetical protein